MNVSRAAAVAEENKKARWKWSLGLLATGLAGALVVAFRGCWHRKMSWPVRSQDFSYQVCLGCGIKRLFDEEQFRSYGPYSYDLPRLVAVHLAHSAGAVELPDNIQQRPAS